MLGPGHEAGRVRFTCAVTRPSQTMRGPMSELNDQREALLPTTRTERLWLITAAFVCALLGAFMAWGIHA
jgi:hypothetical protein